MNKKNLVFGLLIFLALIGFLKRDFLLNFVAPSPYKNETLTIVSNTSALDLSPFRVEANQVTRTANIYEGLVAFDRYLKIVPALAVSWGNLGPTTWEFKLRQEVFFHDGTPFNADRVVENFKELSSADAAELKPYLGTLQAMEAPDPHTLRVLTRGPDPLLLSKLTKFYIHRPEFTGTGPYKLREWVKGKVVSLTAFTDYWGQAPAYRNAEYRVIENKEERQREFENGKIDILVAVPRASALEMAQEQLKTASSLEVNFLMFKRDDPLLKERKNRDALRAAIDPAKIEAIGNYFVRPVSQLVAPGVFGYNPTIPAFVFKEGVNPKPLFGNRIEKITLDFSETYTTLGDYLAQQLKQLGFSVKKNPLPADALLKKIRGNESQLFIVGWQAEDGDAGGFLDAFILSRGEFNGGRYKNPEVDALIEQSRQEMNPERRLTLLQEIMKRLEGDFIAIPLFESSRIYAVKPGVEWEPRLDGLVLAKEVK